MSNVPIFCKFGRNATLHAEGERFRVCWNNDQGYSCGPGHEDFDIAYYKGGPIVAAINVSELVCHVMTERDVIEVNAEHGQVMIRKLAPRLAIAARKAAA